MNWRDAPGCAPYRWTTGWRPEHPFPAAVDDGLAAYRELLSTGWLVPAYSFPPHREDLSVLRIVCRNGFSTDMADLLLADLECLLPELRRQSGPLTRDKGAATGFHH